MDPVVHFEFPYDDRERIVKFYQSTFGWELQKLGEDMGNYVIAVDKIESSMDKIVKAGGKLLGEPMDIPGVGRYVSFYDTEGNRVSILQPQPMGGSS